MKNFKLFYLLTIVFFSCKNDRPYKEVNVIRSEESIPKFAKPAITFPLNFGKHETIILEIDQSNVVLQSWDKDSIGVQFDGNITDFENIDIHEGNHQIVIREKQNKSIGEKKRLWEITTPKFMNLIKIVSQNGYVRISEINGTFDIKSPVGDVIISESSSALNISSQTGGIRLKNWSQKGRSIIQSSSNKVEIGAADDINYQVNIHSGSDTLRLDLKGNQLNCNVELFSFKGEGEIYSDFPMSAVTNFRSDAIDKDYDLRKIEIDKNLPLASLSTGNGVLILTK